MAGDVDYLLRVAVGSMAEYDDFYRRLIGQVPLKNVTSRFAMERVKSTTAYPLPIARLTASVRTRKGPPGGARGPSRPLQPRETSAVSKAYCALPALLPAVALARVGVDRRQCSASAGGAALARAGGIADVRRPAAGLRTRCWRAALLAAPPPQAASETRPAARSAVVRIFMHDFPWFSNHGRHEKDQKRPPCCNAGSAGGATLHGCASGDSRAEATKRSSSSRGAIAGQISPLRPLGEPALPGERVGDDQVEMVARGPPGQGGEDRPIVGDQGRRIAGAARHQPPLDPRGWSPGRRCRAPRARRSRGHSRNSSPGSPPAPRAAAPAHGHGRRRDR